MGYITKTKGKHYKTSFLILSFMIGMLASLSAQLSVEFTATEPSCYNFSNGTITAMGQNGTDPYSYQWNNNQAGPTLIGIGAGNYVVTVTDTDGQMVVDSFLLGQPDSLIVNIRPQGSICDGSSGNFIGSGTGGTPPYTYIWSNGDRDSILETPAAGFYALTINDSKGCKAFETLVVIDPLEVEVITSDVVCAGACDGTARAVVRGGEPPYSFLWNWRADTNQILPNLDPGYYEVTVTDARGCVGIAGDTIHEPDSININLTIEYDTCGPGAKATVTANPDGGTPPYTYMWDNGDTDSTTMYMGLGQHAVTITDANNCKADTVFMIYDTGSPMVVIDSINPNCADSTGKAIARIWGGTPPFTYIWNTGDTTMMIGGLPAGTYWVKVTDRNGCMGSDTVTLVNEDNLEIEVTGENPLCNGVDNGKATVTVLNGTPPYTYLWSTGDMTNMITDLGAGWYYVTVTDSTGCTAMDSIELIYEVEIEIELDSMPANCGQNGSAKVVNVTGGVPPYTYMWDDPQQQTTPTATGLSPGFYHIWVTDSLGCMAHDSVMVRDSGNVVADFEWEFLECYQNDSMLVQFIDRSTGNIKSWNWDFGDGQTSTDQNPRVVLTREINIVTLWVMSFEGCMDTIQKTVDLPFIDVDLSPDDAEICQGDTLKIMATNNDPDYPVTCTWYPDTLILSGQGTNMVMVNTQNLGTYTIYVIKMNDLGCVDTLFTEYTCKPLMEVADTSLISYSQCDSFTIDFSYGDTVNFCWLFGDPNHPDSLSADPAPSYTYPDTGTYIVGLIPKQICKDTIWYPIHVGPSPKIDFTCDLDTCRDTVIVQFTDLSMVPDSITSWNWTFSTGDTSTLQNPTVVITQKDTLIATLVITWGDGCSDSLTMEKVVDPFICYPNGVVIACMGDSTELNPGINPDTNYHYSWSPGIFLSDSTIFNPVVVLDSSLTFTVTITRDSCEKTMDVMVIVPPMFNLEVIGDSIVCDSSEVMLIAVADVPVTYKWSEDPDFDDVFSTNDTVFVEPGRPTIYYVMATDTFGCSKMDTFTVGNYMVGLDVSNDTMICLGDEIMLSATSIFGTDILTYNWEPDSAIVSGDSTGFIIVAPTVDTWYTVKATNQFGCMKTDSVLVMVKDISGFFTISADPDTLIAGVIDSSQLMVTDLPGYTYQWTDPNFIQGPSDIPDPIAVPGGISRVYSVKITDTVGCMAVLEIPVIVIPLACKDFVFVPNAFTPNGDDLNDILFARAPQSSDYYFAIYSRWGELVFESTDPNVGWDGVFNGQAVNSDVYGYLVRYNCEGETFFKKGNVSVLR